jgi:chromate transporter
MNDDEATLWALATNVALLSLFAVGGINAILPEIHRLSVDVYGWMSEERFTDLFAIAQAAPGPNIMLLGLIGSQVAGIPGAAVATLAILGPSSILTYWSSRLWQRYRDARWRIATQNGLVPVALGLVAAGAYIIARTADQTYPAFVITVLVTAILYCTKVHPLLLLALATGIGMTGVI